MIYAHMEYGQKNGEKNMERPTLGLTPKYIWDNMRYADIVNAMKRYA